MAILGDSAGLLFRIKADSSEANKEIAAFTANLFGLGKEGEAALVKLPLAAGAATAAIAGVGSVAVLVTKQLFDLAKEASDYGSEIFDATQKTGQSAEVMSALKYAADQSGSSLEKISGSVAKFTTLLGLANSGNEKAKATLAQYGITATETDAALIQAIKTIAEMTSADQQAAAAAALFKDRTGEVLPVIKSFDGNLPALISKLRDMGLIMSGEDAAAADEFGDQVDTLDRQFQTVKRTLGQELIPVFLDFGTQLSTWLVRNKGEVKEWSESIAEYFRQMVLDVQKEANDLGAISDIIEVLAHTDFYPTTGAGPHSAYEDLQQRFAKRELESRRITAGLANKQPNYSGVNEQLNELTAPPVSTTSPTIDAEAAKKAREAAEKAAEARRKAREDAYKKELDQQSKQYGLLLKGEHDGFIALSEEWEQGFLKGEKTKEQFREAALNNIATYGQKSQALLDKQKEIDLKGTSGTERENVLIQFNQAAASLNAELVRERADVEKTITDTVKKENDNRVKNEEEAARDKLTILKAVSDTRLKQLDLELKQGLINERQYIAAIYAEKVSVIESEIAVETNMTRRKVLQEQINQLRQSEAAAVIDLSEKEKKAHEDRLKNWAEYVKKVEEDQERLDEQKRRQAEEEQRRKLEKTVGSGFEVSAIGQLNDYFAGEGNTAALAGIEAITTAFQGLGQAVGDVVQAYVLYGSAGASVRQVTAQILASIAQQAAVKAIFELAEGFAALALAFFGVPNAGPSATQHFIAAAIYASIAGIAAITGRAVAGDSFKKQASASTGGKGSSSSKSDIDQNPTPYSRASKNAYDSGDRGIFHQFQDRFIGELRNTLDQNTKAIDGFTNKFGAVSPKDVVAAGVKSNPGLVADTFHKDIQRDAGKGSKIGKTMGL